MTICLHVICVLMLCVCVMIIFGKKLISAYVCIMYVPNKNKVFVSYRYQNPYIEEEQTTQWPKENKQNDKQRSKKPTYKTKHRVARTQLKTGVNSGAPER